MQRLEGLEAQMEKSPEGQVSLTDPDARSMVSQGKGTGIVGYNVHAAVDKAHLIVAHVDELPAILIVEQTRRQEVVIPVSRNSQRLRASDRRAPALSRPNRSRS